MAFLTSEGAEYLFKKLSDAKNIKITGNSNGSRVSDVVNSIVNKADNITKAISKDVVNTSKMFKVGTGNVDVSSDVEDGFSEIGVKGVTYQNLLGNPTTFMDASMNGDIIQANNSTNSNRVYYNNGIVEPSKTYTLIFEVIENTTDNASATTVGKFNIVSYNNGFWGIPKDLKKGTHVIKLSQPATVTGKPYFELYANTTGGMKFKAMLLEGDHTNNLSTPSYFKNIIGVGDVAENLFNPKTVRFSTQFDQNNTFYVTSDFIPVIPDSQYYIKGLTVIRYYNRNKEQIAVKNTKDEGLIWTPKNCEWVRMSNYDQLLINEQKLLIQKTMLAAGYDQRFRPHYDGYGIEVVSCGENLWNPIINNNHKNGKDCTSVYENDILTVTGIKDGSDEAYTNVNFITVDLKKNTDYYFHCKSDGEFGGRAGTDTVECFTYGVESGLHIKYNGNPNGFTFNTGNASRIGFRFDVNKNDMVHKFYDFVLTESSRKIECGRYKEDKIRFLIDKPLMKLPNGVCDEITKDGKLIRRVGKVVLNGGEKWEYNKRDINVENYSPFYTRISGKLPSPSLNNFISDKFIIKSSLFSEREAMWDELNNTVIYVKVLNSKLQSLDADGFKKWLAQNPITVYYQLETPLITQLNIHHIRLFKDGYIKTNTFITPETTHVVQVNKSAQIERTVKEVQSLDNKVSKLEGLYDELLLSTSQSLDLLCLDFDLREEDE